MRCLSVPLAVSVRIDGIHTTLQRGRPFYSATARTSVLHLPPTFRANAPPRPPSPCSAVPPDDSLVEDLRVPEDWFLPSKALEESEWLRVTLHKWLDDEYCPEPMNVEISKLAAYSYYESLVRKQADLGEILLKMARDLESLSFQESFHGAFSSANAAINLIAMRMDSNWEN